MLSFAKVSLMPQSGKTQKSKPVPASGKGTSKRNESGIAVRREKLGRIRDLQCRRLYGIFKKKVSIPRKGTRQLKNHLVAQLLRAAVHGILQGRGHKIMHFAKITNHTLHKLSYKHLAMHASCPQVKFVYA